MIPNFISPLAKYCEEHGDMQRIHFAALTYFEENALTLTPQEVFTLGQIYNSCSVDDAEWIYNDYCNK